MNRHKYVIKDFVRYHKNLTDNSTSIKSLSHKHGKTNIRACRVFQYICAGYKFYHVKT